MDQALPPRGSSTRWYAASALDKLKAFRSGRSASFAINDIQLLHQRTSSFESVPLELQAPGDPLRYVYPFVPDSLRQLTSEKIQPMREWSVFKSVDDFGSGAFTGVWRRIGPR